HALLAFCLHSPLSRRALYSFPTRRSSDLLRVLKYKQGAALEFLTRCKYFEVYRVLLNTERRQLVQYRADEVSFRVMLCIGGCGTIQFEGGSIPFFKGDCIFVPADSVTMTITGQAQFLFVRG